MTEGTPLARRRCIPCEGGVPPLSDDRARALLEQLGPGWELRRTRGHDELVKTFRFADFMEAVGFVNDVTPVAEGEGHHPDLLVAWGRVEVRLWTHVAGGLTDNDFIVAAKIDELRMVDSDHV